MEELQLPTYEERAKALVESLVNQGKINPDDLEKARKAQEEKRRRDAAASKPA